MFKRLSYSLFKPKYIGMFIKDKIYMPLIYFVIAVILCSLPTIVNYANEDYSISSTTITKAVNDISEYNSYNAKITEGKFQTDSSFKVVIDDYTYLFGNQTVDTNTYFYFAEEKLVLRVNGVLEDEVSYKDLGYENLDFSKLNNKSSEYVTFNNMINTIYSRYFRYSNSLYAFSAVLTITIDIAVSLLIVYLLVCAFAPILKPRHKFCIAVYSMSWFFVTYIIGSLLGAYWLEYAGLVVTFFFIRKALSSIKIVKTNKK